jgi:hypothetical protein
MIVGILCLAVIEGVQLVQHQMIHPAADGEQMVELLQRLEAGIGVKVVYLVMLLGLLLGWVTLSVGLLGTRLVPRAIPASVLASLLLNLASLEILSRVVLLIGLAWLGVVVVKMGDEAWLASERDDSFRARDRAPSLHRRQRDRHGGDGSSLGTSRS